MCWLYSMATDLLSCFIEFPLRVFIKLLLLFFYFFFFFLSFPSSSSSFSSSQGQFERFAISLSKNITTTIIKWKWKEKGEEKSQFRAQHMVQMPRFSVFPFSWCIIMYLPFTSVCPRPLEPENQSAVYTLSNNDVDPGLPHPWGQTWLSQDLVRTVWKYGLSYSVQGSHKPLALYTHRGTHAYTHIPILQVKLKSDYYQCIPNVLFSKYSSASSAGLFTFPTGRPLQKPALRFPCYVLIDGASWRWAEVD